MNIYHSIALSSVVILLLACSNLAVKESPISPTESAEVVEPKQSEETFPKVGINKADHEMIKAITVVPQIDILRLSQMEVTEDQELNEEVPNVNYSIQDRGPDAIKFNNAGMPIVQEASVSCTSTQNQTTYRSGQLTAGEINDFNKWKLWDDVAEGDLAMYQRRWKVYPSERYCTVVQNHTGSPIVDCVVELLGTSGRVLWASRTDNTGKAELWASMFFGSSDEKVESIRCSFNGTSKVVKHPKEFSKGLNAVTMDVLCDFSDRVDILFAVDATSSMGDEIEYLKTELSDIIRSTAANKPDLTIQLGTIFYRCLDNSYVTRQSAFSEDVNTTVNFIAQQSAGEGGNEAVEVALDQAVNQYTWSSQARTRLLFMVLDEPPGLQETVFVKLQAAVREASKKGIHIIPLVSSGVTFDIDKSLEYLMRSMALATNGTYAFLTNDSGIGNFHTAPSTDDYKVEKLSQLLVRVIDQFTDVPSCKLIQLPLVDSDTTVVVINTIDLFADSLSLISDDEFKVSLYPNPAHRHVTIESLFDLEEVLIIDSHGKLVRRLLPQDTFVRIALDEFTNGHYLARCLSHDRWSSLKFIISK